MMNSALASTMQTQRTTATSSAAKRSSRSRKFTAAPFDGRSRHAKGGERRRPLRYAPAQPSEILLAIEDERDGLFHAQPLALFLHQPRYGFHERRLVRRDDLGEVALERSQVLHLRDLPGAAHIGLRAGTGLEHGLLLIGIELIPQLHRHGDHIRNAHVL